MCRSALLFHLVETANSGESYQDDTLCIQLSEGTLPLLVRRAEVDVALSTSQPFRITALNCDGESLGEIASSFHDGVQRFTLRTDSHPGGVMAYSLTR